MVSLSRFSHIYQLDEAVALLHSLRLKPIYLTNEKYDILKKWLNNTNSNLENIPEDLKEIVDNLIQYKIIKKTEDEDEKVLDYVKSLIPKPAISVCYMILSENCNLACKYCFLGNNDSKKRKMFLKENMSIDTADKAVNFFIKQLKLSNIDFNKEKPVVIFYGGEPLMNYNALVYIAEKFNSLREIEPCIKNIELSMVSNGLLLNKERALKLQELGVKVAISIDGFNEKANSMRVDTKGHPVFDKILNTLNLYKELNIPLSLSVTLSEETIKNKKQVLELLKEYNIQGFGFNILMSSDTFVVSNSYNEKAANFLIEEFKELRKEGIYEDRMMRKIKSFTKSELYFSDCAATAGGQVVIAPNGQVGVCHGCLYSKGYFVGHIDDENFDASKDKTFIEWSQITPVNREECLDCPALGMCGGGCPVNASYLKPNNTIHSIDERFCFHAIKSLDFMVKDLYNFIKEENESNRN